MSDTKKAGDLGAQAAPARAGTIDVTDYSHDSTTLPPGQETLEDCIHILMRHFLAMRAALVAGDEHRADEEAAKWRRDFLTLLTDEQRAKLYPAYQNTIEVMVPESLKAKAYGLLDLRPKEVPDSLDILAREFGFKIQDLASNTNGTGLHTNPIVDALCQNEVGDATLLASLYAGRIVYDHSESQWYTWAGHYWQPDKGRDVVNYVTGPVAAEYLAEAARQRGAGEMNLSNDLIKRAGALRYKNRVNNVLALATSHPDLKITGDGWDFDPWLLPCVNGAVDLRTGEHRPGQPGDYHRAVCPTPWEGLDAQAPRWELFLDQVFNQDAELVAFVKRLLGYGLTGLSVEHVLPIAWGPGRNGKDTLFSTLAHVLGANLSGPVETSVLLDRPQTGETATPGLYALRSKRIVWASETREGARLDAGRVKLLTGGGQFMARPLYGQPVTVTPHYLPFLLTNYVPHASADDDALWSRLLLVPFTQRFVDEPGPGEHKRDPHLVDKLSADAPGILASLVLACQDWQSHGLNPPAIVKAATAEYREDENDVSQFLAECCVIKTSAEVRASDLYAVYKPWAESRGDRPMTQTALGKRLTKRGFDRRASGGPIYLGLGLLTDKEDKKT